MAGGMGDGHTLYVMNESVSPSGRSYAPTARTWSGRSYDPAVVVAKLEGLTNSKSEEAFRQAYRAYHGQSSLSDVAAARVLRDYRDFTGKGDLPDYVLHKVFGGSET